MGARPFCRGVKITHRQLVELQRVVTENQGAKTPKPVGWVVRTGRDEWTAEENR